MDSHRGKKIIIIGGGLGGLCLAQALLKEGICVEVYERDASPVIKNQGYRINLNSEGLTALAQCLPPALYQCVIDTAGAQGNKTEVFDEQLNIVYRQEIEATAANKRIPVNRQTLRGVLLYGLDGVIRFNKTCCRLGQNGEEVTAWFTDGSKATGDLLIAADGANSLIRKQLLPNWGLKPTGYGCIYGKTTRLNHFASHIPDIAMNAFTGVIAPEDKTVIIGSYQKKPEFNNTGHCLPGLQLNAPADYLMCAMLSPLAKLGLTAGQFKSLTAAGLLAVLQSAAKNWHPALQQFFGAVDPASLFPVIISYSVPVGQWTANRVTFIGDAIHTMPPAGGAGANTAFRDAALLSGKINDAIKGQGALPALINDYNKEMLAYGYEAIKRSLQNASLFYRMPAIQL